MIRIIVMDRFVLRQLVGGCEVTVSDDEMMMMMMMMMMTRWGR